MVDQGLAPDFVAELAAKHEELLQQHVVALVGGSQVEVALQTPIESLANHIGVLQGTGDKHLRQRRVVLLLIQQGLRELEHIEGEVIIRELGYNLDSVVADSLVWELSVQ